MKIAKSKFKTVAIIIGMGIFVSLFLICLKSVIDPNSTIDLVITKENADVTPRADQETPADLVGKAVSAQTELTKRVTILQFGGHLDNVHDDTMATQTAVDYLSRHGGGILYYPPMSKSLISGIVHIKSSWITIEGNDSTISFPIDGGIAFQIGTVGKPGIPAPIHLLIRQLHFTNYTGVNSSVNIDNFAHFVFEDVWFFRVKLKLKYVWGGTINRCHFNTFGVYMQGCNLTEISRSMFYGIGINTKTGATIPNTWAINVDGCHHVIIRGNYST